MALRMRDFVCLACLHSWEQIVVVDDPAPTHCGQTARIRVCAPAIRYIAPHFNIALGMKISDAGHLERELKKTNSYVAMKSDVERIVDRDQVAEAQKAASAKRKIKIRETAEKTWSQLHASGQV